MRFLFKNKPEAVKLQRSLRKYGKMRVRRVKKKIDEYRYTGDYVIGKF